MYQWYIIIITGMYHSGEKPSINSRREEAMNDLLPTQACKVLKMETEKGTVSVPLTHLINAEIEPGKVIFSGFSYDIFSSANSEKGE
jgi:hypothetical protein